MQRSSVDLPEPDAPIRQTTLCSGDRQSETCVSTSLSPKRFETPSTSTKCPVRRSQQLRPLA